MPTVAQWTEPPHVQLAGVVIVVSMGLAPLSAFRAVIGANKLSRSYGVFDRIFSNMLFWICLLPPTMDLSILFWICLRPPTTDLSILFGVFGVTPISILCKARLALGPATKLPVRIFMEPFQRVGIAAFRAGFLGRELDGDMLRADNEVLKIHCPRL